MRFQSAAEASLQTLLQDNASCVAHVLQSNYFSRTASLSLSASWERAASRTPINVCPYVHTRDCGGRRRSTAASCQAVIGTLQDAMRALHADDTSSYRHVESELFGADLLLDACVLDSLVPRAKETPYRYVGLKHVKYQSMLDERHAEEFLLMETVGRGVHPVSGHNFVFRMLRSVDVPEKEFEMRNANSHHAQLQVHRGAIHAMLLVLAETSHRGILKMQLWLDVELTKCAEPFYGAFSSLHDAYSLSIRYRQLVENYAVKSGEDAVVTSSNKTSRLGLLASRSNRERKCQTCQRALGFFSRRKKHLCNVCGIFVCSSCLSTTSFQSWKLCGLCYQRNKCLVNRTRVSKMASIASGIGDTFQYITRIRRSYSRQRESILFATAETADELPLDPMQDTKQLPNERFSREATRRRRIDDEILFDYDIKPLAKSVVGVHRAVHGSANMYPRPTTVDVGRFELAQNDLSTSQGPGGRIKNLSRSLLQKAGKGSYDPNEDMSRELSASLFDGTSGSFRTNKLSSSHVQISKSSSISEPTLEFVVSSDNKAKSESSSSSNSTTSSASGKRQDSSTPEPDIQRVGPQRVPAPAAAPAKTVEQSRQSNYPPRRTNPVHLVHSGNGRSRVNDSSRSSSSSFSRRSSSSSSSRRTFQGWASASAGPRLTSLKTSRKAKYAGEHDNRVPSAWRATVDAPIKRGYKTSNLSVFDHQPQDGRLSA